MVKGQMEPKASNEEMKVLFADIDELIDPVFEFGDQELKDLREKIQALKNVHGLN